MDKERRIPLTRYSRLTRMLDYLNLNYIDNKGEMRSESFHEIIENHGDVYVHKRCA